MKRLNLLIVMIMALGMNVSCTGQPATNDKNPAVSEAGDVEVYYFHTTRRCVTCQAVETVAKEAIVDMYGDRVSFTGYNLEETDGEQKARELGVSGQTLLIVHGDQKINITNEGFMYARSDPEKFKKIISDHITPLL
ncbi:MAG TPA: hypothetical protein ENO20_00210 [Bacteroides sp.]|mgnify:CR=1 FL=1|nr:hypothetical protein [Bacteroides sp.]